MCHEEGSNNAKLSTPAPYRLRDTWKALGRGRSHLLHYLRLRCNVTCLTAVATLPLLRVFFEGVYRFFYLCSKIGAVKACLMDLLAAILTVPPQPIQAALRARLLENHTNSVGESYGVVRCVCGKEEELAFIDIDVFEFTILHRLEQHAAFVLVEELGRLVDMVVGSSVWTTHDHHGHGVVVNAIVVDGRLEEMRILLQPMTCQLPQS